MNITQYYSKEDNKAPIYRCRATLQKGYTVVDADESFYRYVGSNSARPFTKLVHPEDAECVGDALQLLEEGSQRLLFRLLCDDGSYRYMYGVFKYNGREQDGFRFVDINILDIMRIHHRYESDYTKLLKYRKFMSHSDELYFEYLYLNDELTIFEYVNNRAIRRFNGVLSELAAKISASEDYTFKQKAEFESLQEYLKNFAETMELELDGELFGLDCGYMHINGGVVYVDNTREMAAGTVKVTGEIKKNDKYYMGPHAFDNATGVYNKRAIKELAMELVATSKGKILLSVMDIDDFKNINDTFGHIVGDEVIAKVAEIIKTTLGNRGYVGRFGGDEFMVVTDKVIDADDFIKIFKTVRKNIMWSCAERLSGMEVTLSIGLATCPDHATSYEELFKIADKCLYIAKDKGKNRIITYKPELHANFDMAGENAEKRMPMTMTQSCGAVVDIMEGLGVDNPELFDAGVQRFIQTYNIDRMSIYEGEGYKLLHSVKRTTLNGEVPEPLENMAFWEQEDAAALFDQKGVLVKNVVRPLEDTHPFVYEELSRQGTENFVAVKVSPATGPKMLVFFELIQRHRKWSSMEEGLLYISGWSLAQRYLVMSGQLDQIKNKGE